MSKVTTVERNLLSDAFIAAREAKDRAGGVGVLKRAVKYHVGYTDFPAADTLAPLDGADTVAVDAEVSVTFNQDVSEGDLSGIKIVDADGIEVEDVSGSLVANKLNIAHAEFSVDETVYTVTVPTKAVVSDDYYFGNKQIQWSFTTVESGET